MRLIHYPPVDDNLITLLLTPRGPGPELLDRDDVIVDSGDMLARVTNNLIPATTHRVVHPDADVTLRCLPSCVGEGAKYPDIRAGTFLELRLQDIGLVKAAGTPNSAAR